MNEDDARALCKDPFNAAAVRDAPFKGSNSVGAETPRGSSLLERAAHNVVDAAGSLPPPGGIPPHEWARIDARKAVAMRAKERIEAANRARTIAKHYPPVSAGAATNSVPPPFTTVDGAASVPAYDRLAAAAGRAAAPRLHQTARQPMQSVDLAALRAQGFIDPHGPVSAIAEEFRLIKRHLLRNIDGGAGAPPLADGARILVTSGAPDEGKTFCAINLAISLAAEQDHEVLLIDADVVRPSVMTTMGLTSRGGLMDVLENPDLSVEDFIIPTNIDRLSVLPAGTPTSRDAEYLASDRTDEIMRHLTDGAPHRIVILDSPPVLSSSPAAVLAAQVGQAVIVVRADVTPESDLRETVGLLAACPHLQLLLNDTKTFADKRRYGSYHDRHD